MGDHLYEAAGLIESIQLLDGGDIHYQAGECVELLPGFEISGDTEFEAVIEGCP